MIKALFFDIDGTLVSFKTHKIEQSTVDAIELAHSKGIKIFISTGRPSVIINNLSQLQEKNLIDGYITMNGAYCFVGDDVLYESKMTKEDQLSIIDFCKKTNSPCIFVEKNRMNVCQPDDLVKSIFYDFLKVTDMNIISFEEAAQKDCYQITPFISKQMEDSLALILKNAEIGRWHPAFTDITSSGNTKQNGIAVIAKHFGFDISQTMAFGDGGNDIGMLKKAGIGVAMGQADKDVKSAANYITSSVDDKGIYNAMKHFEII